LRCSSLGDRRPGLAIRLRRREAESKDRQNLDDRRYRKRRDPATDIGVIGAPEGKRSERPGSDQEISSAEGMREICAAADGQQRTMRYEIGPRIQVA